MGSRGQLRAPGGVQGQGPYWMGPCGRAVRSWWFLGIFKHEDSLLRGLLSLFSPLLTSFPLSFFLFPFPCFSLPFLLFPSPFSFFLLSLFYTLRSKIPPNFPGVGNSSTSSHATAREEHFLIFPHSSIIFPKFFLIFFLNSVLPVGSLPTPEGPGYAIV